MNNRSSFSGKLGFVLAAAGSAVGLGNIWRFPYLAAQYGGGTFLLVYLIMAVTFGFSLMIAEVAIGRKTGLSAIGAFKSLDSRFRFSSESWPHLFRLLSFRIILSSADGSSNTFSYSFPAEHLPQPETTILQVSSAAHSSLLDGF